VLTVYNPICVQPPDGLVGWWPGEGNAFDSLCANNGTFQGTPAFAAGTVGQAFDLDGASRYVDVANSASLNPTAAITVEAWIYPRLPMGSAYAPVVKKAGETWGQQDGYSLELAGPNNIQFWVYLDGGQGWTGSGCALLRTNRWSHVAAVYDGSTVSLYLDGVLVGTPTSAPGHILPSGNNLQFGHDPSNADRYFNGLIDEPSIYTNALSASQIQAIYEAGVAGKCSIPASWLAHYFGPNYQNEPYAGVTADADGDGFSNLQEYQRGTDPNKIVFQTSFANDHVNANSVSGGIGVDCGVPAQMAVLVNSTNFTTATWTDYSPTFSAPLPTTDGKCEVWVGLRGFATDSQQTWDLSIITRDTHPPMVGIISPAPGTTSYPVIQVRGYSPEPLASLLNNDD
jgi:hypothetical protein